MRPEAPGWAEGLGEVGVGVTMLKARGLLLLLN